MTPSDSKTKPLRALAPLLVLVALALYAPYTDAYTRRDIIEVALLVAAVVTTFAALSRIVRRFGTPVVDVRTYPCGSTVQAHGWELAGFSQLDATLTRGCPRHRGHCTPAQNQG